MALYRVECSELVFYDGFVEADSLEEAKRLAKDGYIDNWTEPYDGEHFEMLNIYLDPVQPQGK